jgi:hypothetical protein
MLYAQKLKDELESKAGDFRDFATRQKNDLVSYRASLDKLSENGREILPKLRGAGSGAFPADELIDNAGFVFEFGRHWPNHERAREWAAEILEKRTTFAADGSQIYAGRETTVPIAAVQIGWFENPHDGESRFEKNAELEILTPAELIPEHAVPMNPDIRVEERRYIGEVERISTFLREHEGWQERGSRMPLAFFDNPLLVPFSQKGLQRSLLNATVGLVKLSGETRVPVVGYVARSFSRDILSMLDEAEPDSRRTAANLFDGSLLGSGEGGVLKNWGDRTCFCYSKRRGLGEFSDASGADPRIGFAYLSVAADSTPARLDIPSWIHEHGLLNELIDVVRAECVIGLGYPYPLEAADHAAVMAGIDRDIFFRALQDFSSRGDYGFSVSRKDASKVRRR